MIGESGFEGVGREVDISFVRFVVISGGHCGLVYHRFREAMAEKGAFVGLSAVAFVTFCDIRCNLCLWEKHFVDPLWPALKT